MGKMLSQLLLACVVVSVGLAVPKSVHACPS